MCRNTVGTSTAEKKIYSLNNIVVVDHDGLFIYIDPSLAGSFHDVRCLRNTDLGLNWTDYFEIDYDSPYPVEYLLGDPGYLGMDHFILRRFDGREMDDVNNPVVDAFNRFHSGFRVSVEWGIGGLK